MNNSSNLNRFKKSLETHLNIVKWSPTEQQVQNILEALQHNCTKEEVLQVVFDVYGEDIIFSAFEGIDNSDINSLLLLATKVRENGNK
ncbi:hypothetical protein [Psychrobacter glaciei]|uniref:hypothetical protein n=1 Tax=Psychrobacter glaciei TaxID=619771 RepID=UPI001F05FCC4|nr:hypothetical protein [Psychrobacter glaciei]MCH1783508.1 hypothetical protein [Psychrobacter glaciei]